jgi:UbiD family decarboxylase
MEQNLRSTLTLFEGFGHLHYVDRPVDPQYELGAILLLKGNGPSLFFRKIKGYTIPVVGNLLNTHEKIALSLGTEESQLQKVLIDAVDNGIKPEIAPEGPAQEIVKKGSVDIPRMIPVPTWFEKEKGPYITAGIIVAKDPKTGKRNVSIARLRVEGGDLLLAGIAPTHHLSELLQKAHAKRQPLEIAVAIGNHPAVLVASQMYVALGHDEFDIAGGLLGEPLRLVSCQTVNLEVPAEAEIVLEGQLYADQRIDEGMVSEFHGFYESYGLGQALHVSAVTHRQNPIYQAILPGYAPEHIHLGGVAIAATTCRALQRIIPKVRSVLITEGGMGRVHAIITMHRPARGEAKRAVMLAMGHTNLLKLVIVVDDDIDPRDWNQVEWALAARMHADEDIMIIPGVKADRCEPQERDLTITKVGIIATSRPGNENEEGEFEFARPPRKVLEAVRSNLEKY